MTLVQAMITVCIRGGRFGSLRLIRFLVDWRQVRNIGLGPLVLILSTLHTSKAGAEGNTGVVDITSTGSGTRSIQYNRLSEERSPSACSSAIYQAPSTSGWVTSVTPSDSGTGGMVRV